LWTKATAGSQTALGKIRLSGVPKLLNHFAIFTVHMYLQMWPWTAEHNVTGRGFDTHALDVIDCVQY